jgi:hypothetical protein
VLLRTLVTLVNFGTIAVAIGLLLAFPHFVGVAFYIILGWMIGSLALVYGPWSNRRVGRGAAGPTSTPSTAPVSTPLPSTDLGFCIYCAAPLPKGAARCPACGHAAASF